MAYSRIDSKGFYFKCTISKEGRSLCWQPLMALFLQQKSSNPCPLSTFIRFYEKHSRCCTSISLYTGVFGIVLSWQSGEAWDVCLCLGRSEVGCIFSEALWLVLGVIGETLEMANEPTLELFLDLALQLLPRFVHRLSSISSGGNPCESPRFDRFIFCIRMKYIQPSKFNLLIYSYIDHLDYV